MSYTKGFRGIYLYLFRGQVCSRNDLCSRKGEPGRICSLKNNLWDRYLTSTAQFRVPVLPYFLQLFTGRLWVSCFHGMAFCVKILAQRTFTNLMRPGTWVMHAGPNILIFCPPCIPILPSKRLRRKQEAFGVGKKFANSEGASSVSWQAREGRKKKGEESVWGKIWRC